MPYTARKSTGGRAPRLPVPIYMRTQRQINEEALEEALEIVFAEPLKPEQWPELPSGKKELLKEFFLLLEKLKNERTAHLLVLKQLADDGGLENDEMLAKKILKLHELLESPPPEHFVTEMEPRFVTEVEVDTLRAALIAEEEEHNDDKEKLEKNIKQSKNCYEFFSN